ncbi:hypothetical protein Cpir12675_001039 [Ceratocystis pirilliformis]|uniref:Zn(2)-C6 fungal-type domain-containing protein n=1 Tax=Ceratocystis pirilliformis TaxID=259994 RepID=A0ABR3ZI16_9PEZI
MGRKPNPLILEYFQRGPKLADNSNRYPHTCRLCGEDFPKGRIDSLTGHITKSGKCPAISETERINACLTLHGIPSVPPVAERLSAGITAHNAVDVASATDTILAQQWSALEALAEASRQVDMSEKHDRPGSALVHVQLSNGDSSGMGNMSGNGLQGADRFDLPDQFTLDNAPSSYDATTAAMAQQSLNSLLSPEFHPDPTSDSPSHSLLTTNTHDTGSTTYAVANGISKPHSPITESLATKDQRDELNNDDQQRQSQELKGNQNNEQHEHHYSHDDLVLSSTDVARLEAASAATDLSVAEAATVRLTNSLLDPQLVASQTAHALPTVHDDHEAQAAHGAQMAQVSHESHVTHSTQQAVQQAVEQAQAQAQADVDAQVQAQAQAHADAVAAVAAAAVAKSNASESHAFQVGDNADWGGMTYVTNKSQPAVARDLSRTPVPGHRGGVRMGATDLSPNGRPKHARARFSAARRKEVQEVRKLGACIRCRILRKTCGKGDPCETCCKVLSPRVWRAGCVRTRLHEQLELYSAGVQVVLAQNRYNMIKNTVQLATGESYIEGSLFPTAESKIILRTFEINTHKEGTPPEQGPEMETRAIMIDCDSEDMPAKIEEYMRQVLPLLIEHEPSPVVRVILTTAIEALNETEDELLRHALELWGLVDIIDRERQWHILEKKPSENLERWIRDPNERLGIDIYSVMLIQLNAAAERKGNTTSRSLLNKMQRYLQDSKVKIGFRMFLTALVFLNCIEKSTWGFRAWEQQNLRGGWPLERQPETFIGQGANLASLLKLLLSCRRVLPQVNRDEETGLLFPNESAGPEFAAFYKNIGVTDETLRTRQEKAEFNPVDSRCLELTLCSQLLLGN